MIKYNLKCKNDHEFESWFSDSIEFDKLNKKGIINALTLEKTHNLQAIRRNF